MKPRLLNAPPLDLVSLRPIVLLDIDGVIDVFQCAHAREVNVAPYLPTLQMLPDIGASLALLHAHCAIVWCSTWGRLVNIDAAAAWGLPPLPTIEPLADEAGDRNWKALAVRRIFATWPGTLVWVEDGFRPIARAWASERLLRGARTRLIDVTQSGLTAEIAAEIVQWTSL